MDRETIEKTAKEYAQGKYGGDNAKQYAIAKIHAGRDGFMAGADWRINSAWHEVNEEPIINKPFLIEKEEEQFEVDCLYKKLRWDVYVLENYVTRWAYIADLIPERKEGEQ